MENIIRGKAFVVGDNIDTDQIIPAEFLSYNPADSDERKYFGMHAMSGVPITDSGLPEGNVRFVDEGQFTSEFTVIIGGRNFGCGSSREHAPLAIAEGYARIFYRNSINGGYLVPLETTERLIETCATGDDVEIDIEKQTLKNLTINQTFPLADLGDVADIIEAGGVFNYAKQSGML